jgi:hypothetical protein
VPINPDNIKVILATDCGSTTTKAILIERQADGTYRQTYRGEAPTTVENPFADVTIGVVNSVTEIAELVPVLADCKSDPQAGAYGQAGGRGRSQYPDQCQRRL